jgi:thioesterase domain-containing protein
MSVVAFLAELRSRDVQLAADGERLRCDAPAGVLTPELRDELRQRKGEILEFLRAAEALARQQKAIVPLQPRGTRAPIFAVPGHNGEIFAFRELAQHVGDDQPFFALHPPGLDGHSEPFGSAEDMARYFADQIEAFQAGRPCVVAGYCAAGPFALELALDLERRGVPVLFLALFGCPYPPSYKFLPQIPYWCRRIVLHLSVAAKPSSLAQSWRYLVARLAARRNAYRAERSPKGTDPLSMVKFRFEQAYAKAVYRYRPRRWTGRMCLFWPNRAWLITDQEAQRFPSSLPGWRKVTPDHEVYYGPDSVDPNRMLINADAPIFAELFRQARDAGVVKTAAHPDDFEDAVHAGAERGTG